MTSLMTSRAGTGLPALPEPMFDVGEDRQPDQDQEAVTSRESEPSFSESGSSPFVPRVYVSGQGGIATRHADFVDRHRIEAARAYERAKWGEP